MIAAPDLATWWSQYGNEHTLSDYKGKTVFLNFWATWCGPCKKEIPDIQQLYLDHGENTGDVIILGVAAPKSDADPFDQETLDADGIADFLEEGGYTLSGVDGYHRRCADRLRHGHPPSPPPS